MHDLQKYQSSRKSCLVIIELVVDKFILYIVNKHQCNMFTMCILLFFTVIGNNTMYSKYMIGNTKLNSKLPIVIFQINSIGLIESENLGETSTVFLVYDAPNWTQRCLKSANNLKSINIIKITKHLVEKQEISCQF